MHLHIALHELGVSLWGPIGPNAPGRQDNDVPLEKVVPPWRNRSVAEVRSQARQALMPVDVADDRQYYISVPHGHILQKEVRERAGRRLNPTVQIQIWVRTVLQATGSGMKLRVLMKMGISRIHRLSVPGCEL